MMRLSRNSICSVIGICKTLQLDLNPYEGSTVNDLVSSPDFPDNPSEVSLIPDFSIAQNSDKFGIRLRGLLTPPETGDYTFTIEADGAAELWLNKSNSNYEGREKIESGETVSLEASQQYYIEALYKEGTTDQLNVQWATPSSSTPQIITSEYLTPIAINKGFIKEVWKDILGASVDDLISDEKYPNNPSSVTWLPKLLDVSPNSGDRYGTRIRGNLIPPETGKYKFWIASNANSVLKLNPEGTNPDKTQTIAKVEGTEIYGTAKLSAPQLEAVIVRGEVVQVDLERINDDKQWIFELTTNTQPVMDSSGYLDLTDEKGNVIQEKFVYKTNENSMGNGLTRYTLQINRPGKQILFRFRTRNPSTSINPTIQDPKIDGHDITLNSNPELDFPQYQQWDWNDSQESEEIFLEQGKQYYIEALQKEYIQEDHLSVAWQTPSSNVPEVISGDYLTLPSAVVPVRISATAVEDGTNGVVNLKVENQEFVFNSKKYQVSGLTLKTDSNLNFASGFIGKIETDTPISNANDTPVTLTPVEISAENEHTVVLTEQQVTRLGYQLAAQPGADVTVNLSVTGEDTGAQITLSKTELTFTPENWNQPQFVEVTAVKAGETSADSSLQIVAESLSGVRKYAQSQRFVTVLVVPKELSDDYRITIKANEAVTAVGFDDTTLDNGADLSAIQVQYRPESDAEPQPVTSWNWTIDENGALIAQESGQELLRLELNDLNLPIPTGDNPDLKLQVKVTPTFFTSKEWSKGEVTISGITLYATMDGTGEDPTAQVTVSLVNGQPTVEAHSQLVDDTGVTEVSSFSYTPTNANLPIVASVADQESIVTEFGELKVDESGKWEFEPNINFNQEVNIRFTVNPSSQNKNITINPPDNYDKQAQIITSQLALPDKNATRVEISASPRSVEEGQTTQLTFKLAQPADEDTNIYYEVETPNVNAPGNIALALDENRYINLGEKGIPLGTEFTVELWARPTAFTGTQGLLDDGEHYLRLSDRQIQFNLASPEVSVDIPDTIQADEWFHIAYTVDASGQYSLYINGQKLKSEKLSSSEYAPNSIGKTGDADYFNGHIDEVRLWDVARTETQIQRARSTTVSKDDANLKGYWNFNQFTPLNLVAETSTSQLIGSDGEILDWNNPALWATRQSATSKEDYEPISGFATAQTNVFNLDAGKLGGRTTFAAADFNKDGKADAAILDEYGNLYYYQNTGQTKSGNPQFNATQLSIKLEGANPLTAGDIDGDGDIDLLAGSEDGTIELIENKGNASSPTFSAPSQEKADGSVLSFGQPVSPTLVDLDGDGTLELFTINNSGEISSFSNTKTGFFFRQQQTFARQEKSSVKTLSTPSAEGYFLQFIDLDGDGDKDLLIDHPRNRAGELPGNFRYLENFGTSEKPYFVEAADPSIPDYIAPVIHQVTYGELTLSHPYDQVEFYTFADWDGDGDADLLLSDNEGVIHLRENLNLNYVTISEGQTEATIDVKTIDDPKVEPKEFIKVNISSGLVDSQKYYTDSLNNSAVIEIVDNDQAGIVIQDTNGAAISEPVSLAEDTKEEKTYQVKLSSQPESSVYLKIASDSSKNGLITKGEEFKNEITLYFPPEDWDTPQQFVIRGVDNEIDDDDAHFNYVIQARSADYIYNGCAIRCEGITVSKPVNNLANQQPPRIGSRLNSRTDVGESPTHQTQMLLLTCPHRPDSEFWRVKLDTGRNQR